MFSHSLIVDHFGCFLFWAITGEAAMNCQQMLCDQVSTLSLLVLGSTAKGEGEEPVLKLSSTAYSLIHSTNIYDSLSQPALMRHFGGLYDERGYPEEPAI